LDVHQRISIMEAFHKLSRVASVELAAQQQQQQQLAAATVLGVSASPRGKRLRSHNNSPSPKHKPVEDRVCKDILSLLYSPRITAPHPSPAVGAGGFATGIPSPLAIGLPGAAHHTTASGHRSVADREAASAAAANGGLGGGSSLHVPPSLLGSPTPMETLAPLELEPSSHQPQEKSTYSYASSADVVAGPSSSLLSSSSPAVMVTDVVVSSSASSAADTNNDGTGSALALTGSFVQGLGISSGASSPNTTPGACSEQTSPSAPTESSDRSTSGGRAAGRGAGVAPLPPPRFPAHCNPSFADGVPVSVSSSSVDPPPSASRGSSAQSESVVSSNADSPESPDPNSSRMDQCTPDVAEKQRMMRRTTAAAQG
jgi:hypothetical protein